MKLDRLELTERLQRYTSLSQEDIAACLRELALCPEAFDLADETDAAYEKGSLGGYEVGYEAGYDTGYDEGYAKALKDMSEST